MPPEVLLGGWLIAPRVMRLIESHFTTIAGELYVAHKIAMLGLVPAFIHSGVRGIDLLVSCRDGSHSLPVVVCSVPSATRDLRRAMPVDEFTLDFPLSQRAVESVADSTMFCFVDLMMRSPDTSPEVYVVPAAVLKRDFAGIRGKRYTTARYRRSRQSMEYYRNNWRPFLDALPDAPAQPTLHKPVVTTGPAIIQAIAAPSIVPARHEVTLNLASGETNS